MTWPTEFAAQYIIMVHGAFGQAGDFNLITTLDNEDPVLTPPANITVNTDAGLPTAVVTFAAATATDNSGSATVLQTGGPASAW